MRGLLFLARVAFICNIFFILCVIFRYWDVIGDEATRGFIIVIGWLLAPLVNLILNITLIIFFYRKAIPKGLIPGWLIAFNLIIQFFQLIYIPLA